MKHSDLFTQLYEFSEIAEGVVFLCNGELFRKVSSDCMEKVSQPGEGMTWAVDPSHIVLVNWRDVPVIGVDMAEGDSSGVLHYVPSVPDGYVARWSKTAVPLVQFVGRDAAHPTGALQDSGSGYLWLITSPATEIYFPASMPRATSYIQVDRDLIKAMLPYLIRFAETGSLQA